MKIKRIITLTLLLFCGAVAQTKDRSRTFHASAYSLRGKTASGKKVQRGGIAADPRILKLGTRVHIKGLGHFTVNDTGGSIKGYRIDVWMPSVSEARKFGRKQVELTVLD